MPCYRTWRYGGANGFYTTVLTPELWRKFAMNPWICRIVLFAGDCRNDVVKWSFKENTDFEYDPVTGWKQSILICTKEQVEFEAINTWFVKTVIWCGADGTRQGTFYQIHPDANDYNLYET